MKEPPFCFGQKLLSLPFDVRNEINNWTKFPPVFVKMILNSGHRIQQILHEFILASTKCEPLPAQAFLQY